jgi:hypothetical protein
MNKSILAASLLTLALSQAANATVYYDSSTAGAATLNGADGTWDTTTPIFNSFTAATPDFTRVILTMEATASSSTGSVMVYLVPDDGTAGGSVETTAPGVAGNPLSLASGTLLATINDSSLLLNSPTLVGINFSPSVATSLTTKNQEYWIALDFSSDSSAAWFSVADDSGLSMNNQSYAFPVDGTVATFSDADGGAYNMVVDTPEPASLALLGGALASLGYVRRRRAAKEA